LRSYFYHRSDSFDALETNIFIKLKFEIINAMKQEKLLRPKKYLKYHRVWLSGFSK